MAERLCILVCENFAPECRASLEAEGWTDVCCVTLASDCGRPPLTWATVRSLIPPDCTHALLVGRACTMGLAEQPADMVPCRVERMAQCFHLIAPHALVDSEVEAGSHLVSPGWLRNWSEHLHRMGFAQADAGEFFRGFARQVSLLDTAVDPQAQTQFALFAQTLGLPGTVHRLGLEPARQQLARWVLEWRLAVAADAARQREREHARIVADHVSAMDLLGRLSRPSSQSEVTAAVEDLFRMLFSPGECRFVASAPASASLASAGGVMRGDLLDAMERSHAWTRSGTGFILRIARDGRLLGHVVVDDLALPEHRERYLNLALAMCDVIGLAIESARTRQRLVEAEKMASLGVLVAGMAHEINTPVGVGSLAVSTLSRQTEEITGQFNTRQMTQSGLTAYLSDVQTQSRLIAANLDRIGRLIDRFREVAVADAPLRTVRFRLRECIEDVLSSFGGQINAEHCAVSVSCDATLCLVSDRADWACILSNLIANALQHAFKGRSFGHLWIAAELRDDQLWLQVEDDGIGLTPTVKGRIFDPFFTTDMHSGIGLGMHLVYNVVTQRLNGRITAANRPGGGTVFSIEVPTPTRELP